MSKVNSYPVLAKPSGITLNEHRNNVMSEGQLLSTFYSYTYKKYKEKIGKSLELRVKHVTNYHDDGKQNAKWQRACQLDYENFVRWEKKFGGNYQDYAKINSHEAGKNLRKTGIRHEFQSLVFIERKKLPICLKAAIASHHGKLGFKFEDRWLREGVERFWKEFQKFSNRVVDERLCLSAIAKLHYEFAGPRGLLQLADHRASAVEDGDFIPNHKCFNYKFPHPEKRNVQKLVEQFWQEDLLLIRAATGAGKTDASLLWASKQIENARAERLIIAMPTRFTSNALAINVAESLSDTGLYHSSAWFNKFQKNVSSGEVSKKRATKEHEFARLLQTPVTVCTIDHLLTALTLTREDHHLITFNLANSCLVIDEADFYDDFTQANILILLEVLKHWNVPVLLMSASLPQSVLPKYQEIGFPSANIKEDNVDQQEYKRPRFAIKSITACSNVADNAELLQSSLQKGNAIIYANTIDRALEFFKWYDTKGVETCLYHSRFTEPDKVEKEKTLIKMLGREAWKNGTARGIAILTQIGEMSINISTDLMISDLCPIDRLTQRAGRLCRFDKSKLGELHVLIPKKDGLIYPAPYGVYDRKAKSWISSKAFERTRQVIALEQYSAEKLARMLNEIYEDQSEFSTLALTNARNLKEYFKTNWLINSKQISAKDDTGVNFWKSRDIPPQETVFVSYPKNIYFSNYLAYRDWAVKNSVELPVFLVEKGKDKHMIDLEKITIKDEEEQVYIIRQGFYTLDKGVDFETPEQMF